MSERPPLSLPRTPLELSLEIAAAAGLVWMLGTVLLAWDSLPATIPTHFGISGEPDGWGPRWTIILLPLLAIGLYAALTVMARYPHRMNYPWEITAENAPRQYRLARGMMAALKTEIVLFFGFIKYAGIRVARGETPGLGPEFLPVFLGVTIGTVAVYIVLSHRAR